MTVEIKDAVSSILGMLHDMPTEGICRYFEDLEQECIYLKEDENGINWCNNCVMWHLKVNKDTGVETIYNKHPNAAALHASLLRDLYDD